MELQQFKAALAQKAGAIVAFQLGSGDELPGHFHVTEVGKVTKEFVDCGGTRRSTVACVLQTYVAHDIDHRLRSDKLSTILDKAAALDLDDTLPVEVEVQRGTIGTYGIASSSDEQDRIVFRLQAKETACLAPDKCGLEILSGDDQECCSEESGCC